MMYIRSSELTLPITEPFELHLYPLSCIILFLLPHSFFSFSLHPFTFFSSVSFEITFLETYPDPLTSLGTQHPEFPQSFSSYLGCKHVTTLFPSTSQVPRARLWSQLKFRSQLCHLLTWQLWKVYLSSPNFLIWKIVVKYHLFLISTHIYLKIYIISIAKHLAQCLKQYSMTAILNYVNLKG